MSRRTHFGPRRGRRVEVAPPWGGRRRRCSWTPSLRAVAAPRFSCRVFCGAPGGAPQHPVRGSPVDGAALGSVTVVARGPAPTLTVERDLWSRGHRVVVGMDEVGKGAWAGPLTIGAAVLPTDRRVLGIRDSKLLDEATREALFPRIAGWCVAWSIGHASHAECDELGMSAAQRLAVWRASMRSGSCRTASSSTVDGTSSAEGSHRRSSRATRRASRSPPRRSSQR